MANASGALAAVLIRVSKVFPGGTTAVDDVSLEVREGEFFSLLGPSGCGKTTTLRMLAGLEEPTNGQILIRGNDVTRVRPNNRPTNLIFQKLALFPHLTVAENIAFGPRVKRMSKQAVKTKVADMLDLVELSEYGNRLPAQISGGQQQRVAIARALVNEPAVLLLDEPLGALDLKLRTQMQLALRKMQQESGTTFIFVTHDQIEAMTMSDRMAVMQNGKIDQLGVPADLYNKPRTTFCATFLGDTNLFRGTSSNGALDSGAVVIKVPGDGTVASVRPERIDIRPDTVGDGNSVPVTITDLTFQGSHVRVVCMAQPDRPLIADVPAYRASVLEIGQTAFATWPVEAAAMLAC